MTHSLVFLPIRCHSNHNVIKYTSKGTIPSVGVAWKLRCNAGKESGNNLQTNNRRSANYQPSSWRHVLLESVEEDNEWEIRMGNLKKLEEEVRYMLDDEVEPQALLELINDIDQLGLSYRFRDSIKSDLVSLRSIEEATGELTTNLHASALYFRLLRQFGYEVSPDLFESFRDQNGKFKPSLAMDVQGMLSLYEASHLAYEEEHILDEAKSFTSIHLKNLKEFTDPNISEQIEHALEIPYHHRMQRLEARWKIEAYEKRKGKNSVLLELASQDFNMVQTMLQMDLQEVSRWWKAVDLTDKLSFARDRLMESFFWAIGIVFEPQASKCRRGLAKVATLITVLDDIYDVYGSLDELEQFTIAVERWDLDGVNHLPDYMKLFYLALYNTVNELAYDTLKEKGEMIIPHLKKAWADLCKAFLQEAQWNYGKATPTFDEYLNNAWISVSGAVFLVHAYFLVAGNITKEAIQCLDNYHSLLRWPSTMFRLYNDFGSSKAEIERGERTNAITRYILETGCSEEFARQHIRKLIEECWKKMNKESVSDSPFEKPFIEIAINLARIAQCQYQNGDAHSAPDDKARNSILSVLVEPIQLMEKENLVIERK